MTLTRRARGPATAITAAAEELIEAGHPAGRRVCWLSPLSAVMSLSYYSWRMTSRSLDDNERVASLLRLITSTRETCPRAPFPLPLLLPPPASTHRHHQRRYQRSPPALRVLFTAN